MKPSSLQVKVSSVCLMDEHLNVCLTTQTDESVFFPKSLNKAVGKPTSGSPCASELICLAHLLPEWVISV